MTDQPYTTKDDQALSRVFIGTASAAAAMLLTSCAGYVPGEKAHWDEIVREMCAKDGGVAVLERWRLSAKESSALRGKNGRIGVPSQGAAAPNSPAYGVTKKEILRHGNPEVHRTETLIVRRKDGAILARWIRYGRIGGDFPSHAHPSSFACPDTEQMTSDLQKVFIVEGVEK